MELFNLTDITMKNIEKECVLSKNASDVLRYFLYDNYEKVLGSNEIKTCDCELVVCKKDNGNTVVNIDYMYAKPLSVEIIYSDDVLFLNATSEGFNVFMTTTNPREIENKVLYPCGVISIYEKKVVGMNKVDANRFYILRTEDNELAYEGYLTPILTSKGNKEYFEFKQVDRFKTEEEESLTRRIFNSIVNSSLVTVEKPDGLSTCAANTDGVFQSLQSKLESIRVKKVDKVRKREPIKND